MIPPAVFTPRRYSRNLGMASQRNPLAGLLRIPDLVYVVSVVLSLLAILFAFDSICGEKESGTLRLILSNAVPRDSILLGKWLGGYAVLIVPFLIALLGGLGYAWWRGALPLQGQTLARLGMLIAVACLYLSVFFTLGLFVSTITHRSATALFLCLLIWVAWILVVPNLAPVIAKIVAPAPSAEKIAAEKRAVEKEIELKKSRLTLTSGKLRYGEEVKKEEERLEQEGDRIKSRWDRFLEKAVRRQTDLARTIGRISPSACWTYAAVALTGTGPDAYQRFEKAKEQLQEQLRQLHDRGEKARDETGKYPEMTPDDLPQLQITTPDFGAAIKSAFNDILILAVLNVAFFLGAFMFFLRYDVR